jgi:hypothetical protein
MTLLKDKRNTQLNALLAEEARKVSVERSEACAEINHRQMPVNVVYQHAATFVRTGLDKPLDHSNAER